MPNEFIISMHHNPYKNQTVSEDLIQKSLDIIFEDAILGNYNFFVLSNKSKGSSMQTIFEYGRFNVEYSPGKENAYSKYVSEYEELRNIFINFFYGIMPDINGFNDGENLV